MTSNPVLPKPVLSFLCICLQLPASVLDDIFIDMVLQESDDEAILTCALASETLWHGKPSGDEPIFFGLTVSVR